MILEFPVPGDVCGGQLCSEIIDELGVETSISLAQDDQGVWVVAVDVDDDVERDAIGVVIASHAPSPVPTRAERVADVVDSAPTWQSAMITLAAEGLL